MNSDPAYKKPQINSSQTILMVRPSNFGSNPQTLSDNAFQQSSNSQIQAQQIKNRARQQFNNYAKLLQTEGVSVIVVQDSKQIVKPDAIFPNNWFTTHRDGNIVIWPMKPLSRRAEKTNPVIEELKKAGHLVRDVIDLSGFEQEKVLDQNGQQVKVGKFLQGTGSMVLDHQNKIAYACQSQRTNQQLFNKYCTEIIHYKPVYFTARDKNNMNYYHTNVIMSVCSDFVVVCLQAIQDQYQRQEIIGNIKGSRGSTGQQKQVVEITMEQVANFCGNVLQVCSRAGDKILTMSQTAYNSYRKDQLDIITKYCKVLKADIPCIQTYGGGGTRCMMAEIFLPKLQ